MRLRGRRDASAATVGPARGPVIAIDGPAGAGKSTLARRVAECAGLLHIDTGALYRAVAYAWLQACDGARGGAAQPDLAEVASNARIELTAGREGQVVRLDGVDITDRIREPDVDRLVPRVSSERAVREALIGRQREMARGGGVVVDGRDIGTAVLPDADHKFFVSASFGVRVDRRYEQLRRGRRGPVSREAVARDLSERDRLDATRAHSPLVAAPDATHVDTTDLPIEDAVALVLRHCGLEVGCEGQQDRQLGSRAGEP